MSELPKGWVETTIGELVAFNPKLTLDDDTDIGFVPMSHAPTNFRDKLNYETRSWGEVRKAYTHFANGDVIFAKVTPCFENGKAAVVSGLPNASGAGSSEFHVLRPVVPEISPTYLLAVIKSAEFLRDGEAAMTGAVGLRRVPRSFLETFPVRLPPVAEQARIAQALDALLAQVDTLKARLDALPALIKRFRQSVLSATVSGSLPSKKKCQGDSLKYNMTFFESERLPIKKDWRWVKLTDVALLESGHTPRKTTREYWENGDVPWISLQDIRAADGLVIHDTKFKPTALGIANSSARILPAGTVCFSRDISVGYVTIMGKPMATTQHFANWICHEFLDPKFLMYSFMASRTHLLKSGQGSTVKTIYMPALKELQIALPPIDMQKAAVRHVEQLFAFADQLEARLADARARVDALTQSILAKAFRGELVSQDPADEPASALLERIKAQRAAAPKSRRGRKPA